MFEGMFTGLTEYEEIRISNLVQTSSHDQMRIPLENYYNTVIKFDQKKPLLLYTDKCCHDREFCESVLPSLKDNLEKTPFLEISSEDSIMYAGCEASAAMRANQLLEDLILELKLTKTGPVIIGMDCEWETDEGRRRPVALLQLAISNGRIFLFHLARLKTIPAALELILNDGRFLRVGVRIATDKQHLENDSLKNDFPKCASNRPLVIGPIQDLNDRCADLRLETGKRSLDQLCQVVLRRRLNKNEQLRCSKWNGTLSKEMKHYAALDAIASLHIYLLAPKAVSTFDYRLTIPFDDDETSASIPPYTTNDIREIARPLTRVKLDAYHAMKRIEIPKNHIFQYLFTTAFRDALFELNAADKGKLEKYLLSVGQSFEHVYYTRPDWVLKYVRRVILPRKELRKRLERVLNEFKSVCYVDPNTKKPLLSDQAIKEFKNLLKHVDNDCLSDPPDIPLYFEIGTCKKTKLTKYRCIRGTSDVEGAVHQKFAMKMKAWNAGPEYADACLTVLRDRHNIRASERYRKNFPKVGHYDHYLIDFIQDLTVSIYGLPLHPWWKKASDDLVHDEKFGIVPSIPRDSPYFCDNIDASTLVGYTKSMLYLAKVTKTTIPFLPIQTHEEQSLYSRTVMQYASTTGKFKIDFTKMAADWNNGCLLRSPSDTNPAPKPDGILYTRKLEEHLKTFFNEYCSFTMKKNVHRLNRDNIKNLRALFLAETWTSSMNVNEPKEVEYLDKDVYLIQEAQRRTAEESLRHIFDELTIEQEDQDNQSSENICTSQIIEIESSPDDKPAQELTNNNNTLTASPRLRSQSLIIRCTYPTIGPLTTQMNKTRIGFYFAEILL